MALQRYNAVFEGGGIRGIGIIGALKFLHKCDIHWENVSGTSVGAIIASLVSAGYNVQELQNIMSELNYDDFLDKDSLHRVPFVGKPLSVLKEKGIYSGEYFESWIRKLLKQKGVVKFKDVSDNGVSRLKIIASDITFNRRLVLPDDLVNYGMDAMDFDIARAIRMSISIPFYFKPVKFSCNDKVSYIVDGAVCCNYPLKIFDDKIKYKYPTIGFKFLKSYSSFTSKGKIDAMSFLMDIASTMSAASNDQILSQYDIERTIFIPTYGVEATDFDISRQKSIKLFKAGYKAATVFWNRKIREESMQGENSTV